MALFSPLTKIILAASVIATSAGIYISTNNEVPLPQDGKSKYIAQEASVLTPQLTDVKSEKLTSIYEIPAMVEMVPPPEPEPIFFYEEPIEPIEEEVVEVQEIYEPRPCKCAPAPMHFELLEAVDEDQELYNHEQPIEPKPNELLVYPNPSTVGNPINLKIKVQEGDRIVGQVFDMNGRLIQPIPEATYSGMEIRQQLFIETPGIYLVSIIVNDQERLTERILIR